MKALRVLSLLATLVVSACSHLAPTPLETQLDDLVGRGDLRAALAAVDALPADDPRRQDFAERRAELMAQSRAREDALEQAVNALMAERRWGEAASRLQQEELQLPDSDRLARLRSHFNDEQERAAAASLLAYRILRARHLLAEQNALRDAVAAGYDNALLLARSEALQEERRTLAMALAEAGAGKLQAGQLTAAIATLELAEALQPGGDVAASLESARRQLARRVAQQRQALAEQRRQRQEQALASARNAREAGEFALAGEALQRAADILEDEQVREERHALETAMAHHYQADLERGDQLYASGHIEQALAHWERAWTLRAEPALAERIERARRFLARYQELREGGREGD